MRFVHLELSALANLLAWLHIAPGYGRERFADALTLERASNFIMAQVPGLTATRVGGPIHHALAEEIIAASGSVWPNGREAANTAHAVNILLATMPRVPDEQLAKACRSLARSALRRLFKDQAEGIPT